MASIPVISAGIPSPPTGSTLTMFGEYSLSIASMLFPVRQRATSSLATEAVEAVEAGAAVDMRSSVIGWEANIVYASAGGAPRFRDEW
jgi:hypothetical protein